MTNSLSNLRVSYTGKNSRNCTQNVYIWRWSSSSWTELSSRTVGTTEVALVNLAPSGTQANYVSGSSGERRRAGPRSLPHVVRLVLRERRPASDFYVRP